MAENFPTLTYSHKDAELVLSDLKQELLTFTKGEFNSFIDASPDFAILKTAVVLFEMGNYYLDKQVQETFLSLAQLRESVVRRAKELGYTPTRLSPASCTAKITFPAFGNDVEIDPFSSWSINGVPFTCPERIVLPALQTEITIPLIQGTYYTQPVTAPGSNWYKISLPVNAGNIAITVDGVEWDEVDTFIGVTNPKSYKVYESEKSGYIVAFAIDGDELSKPSKGAIINATAILTLGASGNNYQTNQLVRAVSVMRDFQGNQINNVIRGVTTSLITGGTDMESIDSIRKNAPKYYGTGGRGVTANDLEVITSRFPGVKDVKVTGGEERQDAYRKVFITVYTDTPYELSNLFKQELLLYLREYKMLPMELIIQPPVPVRVKMQVELGVENTALDAYSVKLMQAHTLVTSFFAGFKIESSLYSSALTALLQALGRVRYSEISFSVTSFAMSQAGVIKIPLIKNPNLSECVLKDASGNTLFSGDGSTKVRGSYLYHEAVGLADQNCTLEYKPSDTNIEANIDQVLLLDELTVDGVRL